MNRLHITIFALILLLSQWGNIDHVYHLHDSAAACDYCLSAHVLDHAIVPTASIVFTPSFHQLRLESAGLTVSRNNFRYYPVRAPPRFI